MGILTYETDKLVAVAGITARMQPGLDDIYLAGLWRRHLASEMLWRIPKERGGEVTRPKAYVAPSRPWVSVNHVVTHISNHTNAEEREILVKIISAHVVLQPIMSSVKLQQG
jgi:hypothetical protein